MKRLLAYLLCVTTAGVAMYVWFTATEELDPAASEPDAYSLFLTIALIEGVVACALLCGVIEAGYRIVQYVRRKRARDLLPH